MYVDALRLNLETHESRENLVQGGEPESVSGGINEMFNLYICILTIVH